MNPAFSPGLIDGLVPALPGAGQRADRRLHRRAAAASSSREFAEPYAARVIAIMLGIPEARVAASSPACRATSASPSASRSREDLDRIEAALAGLYGYADELIADRRDDPRDDFVTRLVLRQREEDRLSDDELRVALVLLIFGGMDTTRNQLGLAMQTFMDHPDQWRLLAERPELGRARRRGGHAGQPDGHLGHPRGAGGLRVRGPRDRRAGPRSTFSPSPPAPTRAPSPSRPSTSPPSARRTTVSAAASTTASATSSPAAT